MIGLIRDRPSCAPREWIAFFSHHANLSTPRFPQHDRVSIPF